MNYILTALVLTLAIPIFGFLMEQLIGLIYFMLGNLIGRKKAWFVMNRLTFVGVFHHELAHAILATLTGAKVTKIVFFRPEGQRLGYVTYETRGGIILNSIQHTMTSIAPVLLGTLSSTGLVYYMMTNNLSYSLYVLLIYVLVSIIFHMTMSKQDFAVMWKGIPVVYALVLIGVLLTQFSLF